MQCLMFSKVTKSQQNALELSPQSEDVKNMESIFYPQIMEARQLMEKARKLLGPNLLAQPAVAQKLIRDMDVRLVMHVHGLATKIRTRKHYPSLEAIAQQFAKGVQDNCGKLSDCPMGTSKGCIG